MNVHHLPSQSPSFAGYKPTKPISGRAGKNGGKVHSQTSVIPSHLIGQPSYMTNELSQTAGTQMAKTGENRDGRMSERISMT